MCNVLVALTLVVFAAAALLHGARTIFRDFCFSLLQMFAFTHLHLLFLVLITERRTQGVAHGARVLQCISLVYFFPFLIIFYVVVVVVLLNLISPHLASSAVKNTLLNRAKGEGGLLSYCIYY